MKKIVILGGGFGGIYTLKNLLKEFKNNSQVEITLINNKNYFLFTPLLHEAATGAISIDNTIEPIREIFTCANFNFIHDEILKIDLNNKEIYTNIKKINYDYLVISTGSKPNFYDIKNAEKYTFTLKNLDDVIKLKNHLIHMVEKSSLDESNIEEKLTFLIIGAGPTGIELAFDMYDLFYKTFNRLYKEELIKKIKIILIESNKNILTQFNPKIQKIVENKIKKTGINLMLEKKVLKIENNAVYLDNNEKIKTQTIIWSAGIGPNIPEIIGNILYEKNRIVVNEYLQVPNFKEVFSIGDCAYIKTENNVVPQLAQAAVQEAKIAALNIKNLIYNKPLLKFKFKPSGYLISMGRFNAIGEIKNFVISGFFVWILWKLVYIYKMISVRDKFKTFLDWLINLFLPRDTSEI
jgi:NADH dehydrogenase